MDKLITLFKKRINEYLQDLEIFYKIFAKKKIESLKYIPKEYKNICNEASIIPKIYYTNFEIIKISKRLAEEYAKIEFFIE